MNFVLIHGGWQGGWCWAAVTEKLRADGHQVFAPTLRGSDNGDIDRSATGLNAIGEALVTELRQQQLTTS